MENLPGVLLPLKVGIQLFSGKKPICPKEVLEVGEDVAGAISGLAGLTH